jgi:hypothetical protein
LNGLASCLRLPIQAFFADYVSADALWQVRGVIPENADNSVTELGLWKVSPHPPSSPFDIIRAAI